MISATIVLHDNYLHDHVTFAACTPACLIHYISIIFYTDKEALTQMLIVAAFTTVKSIIDPGLVVDGKHSTYCDVTYSIPDHHLKWYII